MSSSISTSFTPDFSSMQPTVDSASTNSGTPTKPGQNQGSTGSSTVTTTGTAAYASFQGAPTTTGQNINITLGQALGATQGSVTNNSSSTANNNGTQSTNAGDTTPVANTELSTDQQVTAQQGSKGQGSENGSGSQSEEGEDVYMGTAASGLQKGEGTQASTSASSIDLSSNFTLKVDTSETTSSTSTTSSTTSYTDSNGAPALPPGPNVFAMIAESGELSSSVNSYTVSSMVSANEGMNNNLATAYSNQISDIQQYVAAKNSANNKSSMSTAFSWAINITMVVVGCVTADPMLVAAGVAGCIMTADPKLVNQLAGALDQIPGMPKELANVMATLIIVAAACVATGGVAAAGELAADATTVAARAAIEAAEDSAEDGGADMLSAGAKAGDKAPAGDGVSGESQAEELNSSNEQVANSEAKTEASTQAKAATQTEDLNSSNEEIASNEAKTEAASQAKSEAFSKEGSWSDWAKDTTRFKNAMSTPEGRAAFEASIKDQMASGASSVWKNVSEMSVGSIIDTAMDSMANAAKSVSDSAKSIGKSMYDAGASVMRVAEDPLEAMSTQLAAISKVMAKFAGRSSEEDEVIAESASSAKEASFAEKVQQAGESFYANLASMTPRKMIQVAAELALPVLSAAGAVMQYDATKMKKIAIEDQAAELEAKASTTDISQQITISNAQINEVLGDMNASIAAAGNALANMSQLSSETTGELHGAAA